MRFQNSVSSKRQEAQTFLLEGITGSGKTEVYLQTIAELLEQKDCHYAGARDCFNPTNGGTIQEPLR